jgi:hypothetical protein
VSVTRVFQIQTTVYHPSTQPPQVTLIVNRILLSHDQTTHQAMYLRISVHIGPRRASIPHLMPLAKDSHIPRRVRSTTDVSATTMLLVHRTAGQRRYQTLVTHILRLHITRLRTRSLHAPLQVPITHNPSLNV